MSADAVNVGHLRVLVERIERVEAEMAPQRPFFSGRRAPTDSLPQRPDWKMGPSFRLKEGSGVNIESAAAMLDVCWRLCRVGRADDNEWREDRRGFTVACKLTGLGWNEVQKAIADCCGHRSSDAAVFWARYMSQPDARYVGAVYSAYSPTHPSVVKIGFSTRPMKRMKSLARQYGTEIVLGECVNGTMLHEWALHQIIRKQVAPEWYRTTDIPSWLMPKQLMREAA